MILQSNVQGVIKRLKKVNIINILPIHIQKIGQNITLSWYCVFFFTQRSKFGNTFNLISNAKCRIQNLLNDFPYVSNLIFYSKKV